MRIGSLFTGYGGLDIAVEKHFGGELAWYSEIDKAACTVLQAHHPTVPNLGDITKIDWSTVEPVDILTGGYPCQPFSNAGKRKGKDDERHLWPYVRDAVGALRPRLVVLENVRGHLSLGLADVIGDLASLGYDAQWGVVRASDAGAPHQRARVFIVAYPEERGWGARAGSAAVAGHCNSAADTDSAGRQGRHAPEEGGSGCACSGSEPCAGPESPRGQRAHRSAAAADADGEGSQRHGGGGSEASTEGRGHVESGTAFLADADGSRKRVNTRVTPGSQARPHAGDGPHGAGGAWTDWGKYAPAIHRWERVLGRPAPSPTIPSANGRPRLSPFFVEWMMGLPEGHVTGHGLSGAQTLKMLGNGVVWQQAFMALGLLCPHD